MNKLLKLLLLITCFVPLHLSAWGIYFHRIGAQIAKEHLSEKALNEVNRYINMLSDVPPKYKDMALAGSWLDEIRPDIPYFALYHYTNKNVICSPKNFACKATPASYDSIFAVRESLYVLKNEHASDFAKALSLRVLIHIALDIHQPLHSTELCSKDFPKGDEGGNKFVVSMKTRFGHVIERKLHQLWDDVFYIPIRSQTKGSASELVNLIHEDADELIREAGTVANYTCTDPKVWAEESRSIAENLAYKGISPHQTLSEAYVRNATIAAKKRIVLGGLRLAHLLEGIFGGSKTFR